MAFVYWIHLPEHTDITTEGYIGFTSKTVEGRYTIHLANKENPKTYNYALYRAIRKYGEVLEVTTLVEGSNDYCLGVEFRLRPTRGVGWNMAVGGGKASLGFSPTDETRKKLSIASTGRKHTEESLKKMRDFQKGQILSEEKRLRISKLRHLTPINSWDHPLAIQGIWRKADEIYLLYIENPTGHKALSTKLNIIIPRLKAMVQKFKEGWIPLECTKWSEKYKVKEIQNVST